MPMLSTILYCSRSQYTEGHESDQHILSGAIRRNRRLDVSGFLLRGTQSFCQVIEGAADNIEEVYGAILGDARHVIEYEQRFHKIEPRRFSDWHMAMETVSAGQQLAYDQLKDPALSLNLKLLIMRSAAIQSKRFPQLGRM